MNDKPEFVRDAAVALSAGLGAFLLTGCVNLPPDVRQSVDATRTGVEKLHATYEGDARTFARMVEQREIEEIELRNAIRREAKARAKAEVARFKAETMAAFDRYAQDELGIQFEDKVERLILPRFDPLYAKDIQALADAAAAATSLATDPSNAQAVTAAARNLDEAERLRPTTVTYFYFELVAAISKERAKFETQVDQVYGTELRAFLDGIKEEDASADAALIAFEANTDAKIQQINDAYDAISQALSDISADVDAGAVSRRVIFRFGQGFGGQLLTDLSTGQLGGGGTQLTGTLENKIDSFTKSLGQDSGNLQNQAQQAVTSATGSVPLPIPSTGTAGTQPTTANAAPVQPTP